VKDYRRSRRFYFSLLIRLLPSKLLLVFIGAAGEDCLIYRSFQSNAAHMMRKARSQILFLLYETALTAQDL
jgi:hypothetical protein